MGNTTISLIIGIGAGAWLFNKLQQSTGYGNTRSAITAGVIAGLFVFGVILVLLKTLMG